MEQTPAETTAGAVRAELARKRITGRQMARDLGWSVTPTHYRITGKYPFTIDQLVAIADYLQVPLVSLLPADRSAAS